MLNIIDEALLCQHGYAINMTELILIIKVAKVVESFSDCIILDLWQLILLFFQGIISVVIWLRYYLHSIFFVLTDCLFSLWKSDPREVQDDVVQDLWSLLITHYFVDLLIEIVPVEVRFGPFTIIFAVIGLFDWSLDKCSFSWVLLLGWNCVNWIADFGLVGLMTGWAISIPSFVWIRRSWVARHHTWAYSSSVEFLFAWIIIEV